MIRLGRLERESEAADVALASWRKAVDRAIDGCLNVLPDLSLSEAQMVELRAAILETVREAASEHRRDLIETAAHAALDLSTAERADVASSYRSALP